MPDIPATGSVDDVGRLIHEDDAAAQLALSVSRLEAAVTDVGRSTSELTAVRVLTTDRLALDQVYDVLTERLEVIGVRPDITVETVDLLPVPGMVVALEADLGTPRPPYLSGLNEENPPPKERS